MCIISNLELSPLSLRITEATGAFNTAFHFIHTLIKINKFLQIISSQSDHYMVSNADIEKYASMQKIYDTAYDGGDVRGSSGIDLDKIVMLKREESAMKDTLEQQQFKINQEISDLESIKRVGFTKVSYLYPVASTDSTKYYPNSMIFFGISLLVAFFYNLFILNFLHIKYKKSA